MYKNILTAILSEYSEINVQFEIYLISAILFSKTMV